MRNDGRKPPRKWALEQTNTGIWGLGRWDSGYLWGSGDPQRQPLSVDRYTGTGHWGRHQWITDFWVRW